MLAPTLSPATKRCAPARRRRARTATRLLRPGGAARHGPGIVVGGRHRVLGREAVVDGNGYQAGRGRERAEEPEVRRGEGRVHGEGAAVEVDEEG